MVSMQKAESHNGCTNMKFLAGLVILAASFQPYFVWADSAAAAAAAASSSNGDSAAAAAAAASSGGNNAAAAAAASSSSRANFVCNCPRIYDPVCGSDGRTYSNACVLRCVSDNNVSNGCSAIRIQGRGECPRKPCTCNKVLNPVCGSDGNTYANPCYFDCENARRKAIGVLPINVAYPGTCKRPVCSCSDVIIPVCGTDSRTYRNICILQCISRINQAQGKPAIYWQYSGACKQEKCTCPSKDDFLCGSDGRTYKNQCALSCQNRRLDQLGIRPVNVQYKGKCTDCICSYIYDPVCAGSVTFRNRCTLSCENKRRAINNMPPLKISCESVCPCYCTLQYQPVCGSDRRTYGNACLLNCENIRRKDLGLRLLSIAYKGRCICDCKHCKNTYEPVCGSDSRTYWNMCWLNCNRACSYVDLYPIKYGPC